MWQGLCNGTASVCLSVTSVDRCMPGLLLWTRWQEIAINSSGCWAPQHGLRSNSAGNASSVMWSAEHRLVYCNTAHFYARLKALLSGTTRVSRYQQGKTNLDFTEARGSEWQWYQLGHMQVYTSLQTDNHPSTPTLRFLQAECHSCHPTNSIKALKALCVL